MSESTQVDVSKYAHIEQTKSGKNPDNVWLVLNEDVTGAISNPPGSRFKFRRVFRILVRPKNDEDRARDKRSEERRAQQGGGQGGYRQGGRGYGRQGGYQQQGGYGESNW